MTDYTGKIQQNEAEIINLKVNIRDAEDNRPQSDDDRVDILRWSQEITVLKLENEILEIKRDVPAWRGDADTKKEIERKETKLEEMRDHNTRSLAEMINKFNETKLAVAVEQTKQVVEQTKQVVAVEQTKQAEIAKNQQLELERIRQRDSPSISSAGTITETRFYELIVNEKLIHTLSMPKLPRPAASLPAFWKDPKFQDT